MASKLENAYASAAATTRLLQEEGREESPFEGMFGKIGKELTDDLQLKNLTDPDYEVSDSGAILSMFAPKFRENALARGLEKQAEIDKQIWFSQAGQRELQAEETLKNSLNLDAARNQSALKQKIELNASNIIGQISNKEYQPDIFKALRDNPNQGTYDALKAVQDSQRMVRIERSDVQVPGTPILSFMKDNISYNVFDKNTSESARYRDAIKKSYTFVRENLNEDSKLPKELLAKFKGNVPLNFEERKQLINNPRYNELINGALLKNNDALMNYPPTSDEISLWETGFEKEHKSLREAYLKLEYTYREKSNALHNAYQQRLIHDEKEKSPRTIAARDAWLNSNKTAKEIKATRLRHEQMLGVQVSKYKRDIAYEMSRLAHQQNTTVHKGNAKALRQQAWRNVQEREILAKEKSTRVSTDATDKSNKLTKKTTEVIPTGKKEEEVTTTKKVDGITWRKAKGS